MMCGAEFDHAANAFENKRPRPGAVLMCIKCGVFQVFDENLRARPPTAEEFAEFSRDSKAQRLAYAHAHVVLGGKKQ